MDSLLSHIIVRPKTRCWIWTRSTTGNGYGRLWYRDRHAYSHRLAYELYKGEIPQGQQVLHRCDVPACCNPDHLFLGTITDNMVDCVRKGRHHKPTMPIEAVREIKYGRELTRKQYAAKFGVTLSAVNDIRLGRCWRHV